ncbi:sel1 repeat family protein, partial [Corallococcus sp. AB049A]|uniref:tetratricopeptide repeat protein n=1 Tax=Corallococcus sp. AB049A TaxID=2316721 RepID=UPI000ECBD45D
MATRTPIDSDALAELLQHDPQAAFARVRDAAQAGQVDAQLLLAQMHMEGKGTAQDASAALLWYETAANNGAPMAMNMLGRCHELGHGTAVNLALAAVWYRRAADTGLDWGLYLSL